MRKRSLPGGQKCRRVLITATERDLERWRRRADEFKRQGLPALATRSGAIRADATAAQRFNHDARQSMHALKLLARELREGSIDAAEAAGVIDRQLAALLALVTAPPDDTPGRQNAAR